MITLQRHDDVFLLNLGDGDNRFNAETVASLHRALDEIEGARGPAALLTVASGKIWSNGLDLDYIGTIPDTWLDFVADVGSALARIMRLPMFTVAAIQGHAFAAGAMLALAHDHRMMRSDRGYFCLPEVDLGIVFAPGMAALIAAKLGQPALHRLAVMGERVDAHTALQLGAIDRVCELAELEAAAFATASTYAARATPTIAAIRKKFYADAITALPLHDAARTK